MPGKAGEIEVSGSGSEHGGGTAVGIVIIASNNGAATGEHFPDRAEMIARIKICRRADVLALNEIALRHGVGGIAELTRSLPLTRPHARSLPSGSIPAFPDRARQSCGSN